MKVEKFQAPFTTKIILAVGAGLSQPPIVGYRWSPLRSGTNPTGNLIPQFLALPIILAVGAGFEPAVQLPVRQFSKLVVSATHPSHRSVQ